MKTLITFFTEDPNVIEIIKDMRNDGLAYECSPNEFKAVYPLEEFMQEIKITK